MTISSLWNLLVSLCSEEKQLKRKRKRMNGMYFLMSTTISADFANAKNRRYQKKIVNK